MERYNIFSVVHKGLRAALYQTALQLQQTDFTEQAEMEAVTDRVKEIVMLFEGHAEKEDHYILPAINDYEPSVVATFNSEHHEDEKLGIELKHAAERIANSHSLLEKIIAGRALTEAFVRFMVFNLNHMAKEENILNKILWRYYTDEEIKNISKEIGRTVAPWIQDFYAKWILRGISNPEAAEWITDVRRGAPAEVFQTLMQKAKQELPLKRYKKIIQTLSEEAFVSQQ